MSNKLNIYGVCPKCGHKLKFVGNELIGIFFGITIRRAPNEYWCSRCKTQFFYHSMFNEFVTRGSGVYH